MDRMSKIILAISVAFLAVIIGAGIGRKMARERIESPPAVSKPEIKARGEERLKPEVKEGQAEISIEIPEVTEETSPPSAAEDSEAYPEEELSFFPGVTPKELIQMEEEGLDPQMWEEGFFPPDYLPEEEAEFAEESEVETSF